MMITTEVVLECSPDGWAQTCLQRLLLQACETTARGKMNKLDEAVRLLQNVARK